MPATSIAAATTRTRNLLNGRGAVLMGIGALAAIAASIAAAKVVRARTLKAEHDHPPAGKFINVEGVQLHYLERGPVALNSAGTVVLLHGNGTMADDFDISGVLDLAATHYRVVAFDRPGYGHSTRPRGKMWTPRAQAQLLHQAFRRLGIERPIIVGHSWGTLVAMQLALDYPEEVRSLVLLSGYYFPTLRLDVPLAAPSAIPVIGTYLRNTISPLLGRLMWGRLLAKLFGPSPVPPRFSRFPVGMSLRPSQLRASAAESALMIPCAFALSRRYRELARPAVILAGEDDRVANTQHQSVRLHERLRHSELRLMPGAGHMVHHVLPHQVLAAIDAAAAAH
jgi:pimeloyl-ACP methyl ester carboxylesterase